MTQFRSQKDWINIEESSTLTEHKEHNRIYCVIFFFLVDIVA